MKLLRGGWLGENFERCGKERQPAATMKLKGCTGSALRNGTDFMTGNSLPQLNARVQSLAAPGSFSPLNLKARVAEAMEREAGAGGVPKTILSLFDFSGNWSRPYAEAGHNVVQIDSKLGTDVMDINAEWLMEKVMDSYGTVDGILAAPPCTDFSVSGAQYWPAKDKDGRTAKSVELVRQVLRCVEFCKPDWWALENPVGRIDKLVPELGRPWFFDPCDFGDAYTKRTGLWGKFLPPLPLFAGDHSVVPVRACSQGSWLQTLGGKSERTKTLRSATPLGFAYAFYLANHWGPLGGGGRGESLTVATNRKKKNDGSANSGSHIEKGTE